MRSISTIPLAGLALITSSCKGRPDLVPGEVRYRPDTVHVGDEVYFSFGVRNQGKEAAPEKSYEVELYVDDSLVNFDRGASSIDPDKSIHYSRFPPHYDFKPTAPGTYTYRLIVDPKEALEESNERNNVATGSITVRP